MHYNVVFLLLTFAFSFFPSVADICFEHLLLPSYQWVWEAGHMLIGGQYLYFFTEFQKACFYIYIYVL